MFKDDYKVAMDNLTEATCSISADDILQKANQTQNMVAFRLTSRKARRKRLVILAAACITFLAMTTTALAGTAGYGPLAEVFSNLFHDNTSADLVEKGYLYEINQSVTTEDGKYTVDLIAATGDESTPYLLIDVTLHDEALAKANDEITIYAYTLGVEQYENELEHYAYFDAKAYKDEKVDNLYHAELLGAPAWLTSGEEVVVDVCRIDTSVDTVPPYEWAMHELHAEFRFTPPKGTYHEVITEYYEDQNIVLTNGEYEYKFEWISFGPYYAELVFDMECDDPNRNELEELHNEKWSEFIHQVTLIADGVEYTVTEEDGYVFFDDPERSFARMWPQFPAVDIHNVTSLSLKYNGEEFKLK